MTKIQERRNATGLSRSELSRQSGVPLRTLEEWEADRRVLRNVYQLANVAKVLGCLIEDLIVLDE